MISVIICSRSINLFEALSVNISKTIGVPYEIVRVENSAGVLGICAAYNKGASESNYPFLCFVHEDVQFVTKDWGINIINHFLNDKSVGLIGTSGGIYKKRMISNWGEFENNDVLIRRVNIIQQYKFSEKPSEHIYHNPLSEEKSYVVNMDGVFLCTTKRVWEENRFDEKVIRGFHAYDLDFSMQIVRTKKLLVIYDVLLEHFSEGVCDLDWYDATLAVHLKWKDKLPVSIDLSIANHIDIYNTDWSKLRYVIHFYMQNHVSYFRLIKVYWSLFSLVNYKGRERGRFKDFLFEWIQITRQYFSR